MRALLNATSEEANRLGGDFTQYRDWLKLNQYGLNFSAMPSGARRASSAIIRTAFEKTCRTWYPLRLRRRLFLASRYIYVPAAALDGAAIIFSHLLFPWLSSGQVPIVWSSQGISPSVYYDTYNHGQWNVEEVGSVYRVLGRRADALVISTEACARNVLHWCPELEEKTYVAPAPVFVDDQVDVHKPSTEDGIIRLLFVGIDAMRKGLPAVLEAYRVLKTKFPGIELDVVSRPPPDLREKIAALDGARLYLSSSSVDVKKLMARADIFVLPTHADTYALAAVEAMAHGCAVIISDLEPLPELVRDKEQGFVVPAGNARALVEKVEHLLTAIELLRTFQESARQRYRSHHAPSVVAKRLSEIFEQVAARRGRAGKA